MAGIYIHIPFCKKACTYCNFHFSTSLSQKAALLNAIHKEIIITANAANNKKIETIYIGGGTPSLLSIEEIGRVIHHLKNHFALLPGAEVTLEANPDDINKDILKKWQNAGINRLSVGIQTFKEEELLWMNRAHNTQQAIQSIDAIIQSGFTNFSVDLIYGSPLLNNEEFQKNVQYVIDKKIPHLSAYALTVEPKTKLHHLIQSKKTSPVDEERQAEQFDILVNMLQTAGYEQYEISNFAKPGFHSKHNSSYWEGKPYFGFGPAAHSYDGNNIRRWNIANNAKYIESIEGNIIPFEEERLTDVQLLNEFIMISLRTKEGIDLAKVKDKFGGDKAQVLLTSLAPYLKNNKIVLRENKAVLTHDGKFFADGIAADLFV